MAKIKSRNAIHPRYPCSEYVIHLHGRMMRVLEESLSEAWAVEGMLDLR
jgi:hypothetical protein